MAVTIAEMLKMSQAQLDDLFTQSPAGEIPSGEARGTAIVAPGTTYSQNIADFINHFAWQGKNFDPAKGVLRNKILPFGINAIIAKVYKGPSWLDNKECIVLDYSDTSLLAHWIRDEIREVAPRLYLGKVYWGKKRLIDFALEFPAAGEPRFPAMAEAPDQPAKVQPWKWRVVLLVLVALITLGFLYFAYRFTRDAPVTYSDPEEHFKYGSTGGERESGIPYWIWKVLPKMFPEYLPDKTYTPGQEYVSLGFLYEPGKDLPIGVSRRNTQGLDRVFLNCSICHAGSVRETPQSSPVFYAGMPSNTVDLEAFERFIFACASDQRFRADRIMCEMEAIGGKYDLINRFLLRYYAIPLMRERLIMLQGHFRFVEWEPDAGPGRTDTFNPAKTLLEFPLEKLETRELVGLCDFPSIWLQGPRKERQLHAHWDGNNSMMEERNKSAAFGTGTFPPTIDLKQIARVEQWLLHKEPPKYPFPINAQLSAQGEKLYAQYCANCHGRNGRDFTGEYVGDVVPIAKIGTDRHRLDSYTEELAIAQNTLYAGYPWRFSHFRKTFGYANLPLDGIWLRGPYLHNGSVPTLRDLLNPPPERPAVFYRGYDVFDPTKVGFVSDISRFEDDGRSKDDPENRHRYFKFDTQTKPNGLTPRDRNEGNSNAGHEGVEYGTMLSAQEKDALVEYLKTF